ncbi:sigma factor [Nocardioides sp. Leaf285]|uniref:sigma factor n=1 Tax=Nocardioides sp. Leaf285 TaxID=1736322 RepID=UPI000703BB17|nr:sigma factor [Nocardioides sp. Leaf285]KQP62878.1 hypothetical protein ASF47_17855 [Nocardioides sp. Leaf285]
MSRQTISSSAATARENARHATGEFGVQPRAEADGVALLDYDWSDVDANARMFEVAQKAARRVVRSTGSADRGYSADDVAQDALVAVLERRARGGRVDNVHAYINTSASNLAARAGRASVRAEDFAAYRALAGRIAEKQSQGQEPTTEEIREMAHDIRENWHDARHRPSPEFVQNVRGWEVADSDRVLDDHSYFDRASLGGVSHNDVAPGSWLDRALDGVEGEERNLREARKMLWNAVAERQGAPLIETPHLGHRNVTAARRSITPDTDVQALVARWEDETLDVETENALFAPWPGEDIRDRAAVANLLSANPDYSYGMWDSALRAATKPR